MGVRVSKSLAASLGEKQPKVGKGSNKYPPPGSRASAWTADEVARLISLRAERRTLPQIAETLGRAVCNVQKKWAAIRAEKGMPRERGWVIADAAAHFWARVDKSAGPDQCWPWSKAKYDSGYGVARFDMGNGWKNTGAHRIAFFLANGRAPAVGMHVLHSCDNKVCCNPAHLAEGTRSENMKQAWERGLVSFARRAGEDHPQAGLTETQVRAIRRLREQGALRKDIAEAVGVSLGCVDNIVSRRSWGDVA